MRPQVLSGKGISRSQRREFFGRLNRGLRENQFSPIPEQNQTLVVGQNA